MAQQQVATQLQRLPDDTLATILRRLCPRSLAASRCVCKTWRAAIDHRRLLRTDLLPHSLHGIFIMERLDPSPPKFIANPAKTTTRRIAAADFDYVYGHHLNIKDHCDGLLLLWLLTEVCALIYSNMEHQLQVWLLTEVCGKMEWTLKTDASLVPIVAKFSWVSFDDDGNTGPWILHKGWSSDEGAEEAPTAEDNSEWDFDNGVILENEDIAEEVEGSIYFLGFHPCKEIVFLWVSEARVVAYDFSSSKVQDLGQLLVQSVGDAFPYTPCWLEELFD